MRSAVACVGACLVVVAGCGGSTSTGGSDGGASATGGAGAGGGSGGTGGSSGSGTGGASGSGGTGGSSGGGGTGGSSGGGAASGSAGLGGAAGAGGSPCGGLGYCECAPRSSCLVVTEDCFCPCGEVCEPDCVCACGGGAYLGCMDPELAPWREYVGTWLVGWSGGLNHFSWVRVEPDGTARFLSGEGMLGNVPFWECSGTGSWHPAARPNTLALYLPAGCEPGFSPLTFLEVGALQGYPRDAVAAARVEVGGREVDAYRFRHAQCTPSFASCIDPL